MKDLIIFGTGTIAQCMAYYFEREGQWRIAAFCVDAAHKTQEEFLGRPVVTFEEIETKYPPAKYVMFVALGYHQVNALRRLKFDAAKAKGYRLASYVSPHVTGKFQIGENSFVLDGAVMQPFVELGNDVFVWGGAMLGHNAVIEDHCWITGSANIGGFVHLGKGCFVGLNATVGQSVTVGKNCILGANSLSTKNVPEGAVIVVRDTEAHRLGTDHFLKITSCF